MRSVRMGMVPPWRGLGGALLCLGGSGWLECFPASLACSRCSWAAFQWTATCKRLTSLGTLEIMAREVQYSIRFHFAQKPLDCFVKLFDWDYIKISYTNSSQHMFYLPPPWASWNTYFRTACKCQSEISTSKKGRTHIVKLGKLLLDA
jgi:hypothetical protein